MTQDELLKRLEAILVEHTLRSKSDEEWRAEVRLSISLLREDVTAMRSSIEGAGGIVGKSVCALLKSEHEQRMENMETVLKAIGSRMWALLTGTLLALIGVAGALFVALHKTTPHP